VRGEDYLPERAVPFEHLLPLPEVISASLGISAGGDKTDRVYRKLLKDLGTEADILRLRTLSDIKTSGGERIAEGVKRLREGRVIKTAGFDGEYGKIGLFTPDELKNSSGQLSFLDEIPLAVTECEPTVQKNVRQEQVILDEATDRNP